MGKNRPALNKVKILDLRPTQFAVGMLEIDEKIKTADELSEKQLRRYVEDNPVPVVVSPHRALYIVDHHHFLCVCYHMRIKKVRVTVVEDLSDSKMSYATFWKWMTKNNSVYPYCQFGEGPRSPLYLPKDIRGLADDPYRSIAWFVRKAGGFENTDHNFAEFQWANFFRSEGLLEEHGPDGLQEALVNAVHLAQSPRAKDLPGYDKLNFSDKQEVVRKVEEKSEEISKS